MAVAKKYGYFKPFVPNNKAKGFKKKEHTSRKMTRTDGKEGIK